MQWRIASSWLAISCSARRVAAISAVLRIAGTCRLMHLAENFRATLDEQTSAEKAVGRRHGADQLHDGEIGNDRLLEAFGDIVDGLAPGNAEPVAGLEKARQPVGRAADDAAGVILMAAGAVGKNIGGLQSEALAQGKRGAVGVEGPRARAWCEYSRVPGLPAGS